MLVVQIYKFTFINYPRIFNLFLTFAIKLRSFMAVCAFLAKEVVLFFKKLLMTYKAESCRDNVVISQFFIVSNRLMFIHL